MTDSKKQRSPRMRGISKRISFVLATLASLYVLAVALVMTPIIQTYVLYAHHIDAWPWYNKFDHPEHYGLAPGKTVNLKLHSADNTTLGAWFLFSESFYRQLPYPPPSNDDFSFPQRKYISEALQSRPTILFLHGNTGTRAHPLRTVVYTALTSRLNANIMAVDYRGYGDSEGHPTVHGVGQDARAAWDYLMSQGAKPEDVLILGHSLGTAIAGLLSSELSREGIHARGTVLLSAFSSVRKLIDEYYLFGCLPLLKPLSMVPLAPRLVTWSLVHRFDTLSLVPDIKSSVLIAHADDDKDIPSTHASLLFEAFLGPHLPSSPSIPENPLSHQAWDNYTAQEIIHDRTRQEVVVTTAIKGYGVYEEMKPHVVASEGRKVALLRTDRGGHDIGRVEGVQDAIGRMFGFYD